MKQRMDDDKKRNYAEDYGDWVCDGPVRGSCGKLHKSVAAADKHCQRDGRDCKSVGGYSDRSPCLVRPPTGRIVRKAGRDGVYSLVVRSHEVQYAGKPTLLAYCEERGIRLGYVAP